MVENPAYLAWIARDQKVLHFLLNSLSPDILSHVLGMESTAEVWATINSMFSSALRSKVQHLLVTGDPGLVGGILHHSFLLLDVFNLDGLGRRPIRSIEQAHDVCTTKRWEHKGFPEKKVCSGQLLGWRRTQLGGQGGAR